MCLQANRVCYKYSKLKLCYATKTVHVIQNAQMDGWGQKVDPSE